MRIFVSIDIPEEIKSDVIKIQENLPEFFGKKTAKENLHLTLKFLGEINEKKVEEVKKKLRKIKFDKFESKIDCVGVFDEKFIRIIWLHMSDCDELQKEIDEKLKDLFDKEKRFMSHLTIARVKSIKDKKKFLEELKKIEISKIKFKVENFYLMKSKLTSEGPRYEILKEYVLD